MILLTSTLFYDFTSFITNALLTLSMFRDFYLQEFVILVLLPVPY